MQAKGFTLVEMLVVLAIMVLVMAFAVPAYSRLVQQQRLQLAGEALRAALASARIEAIRQGVSVRVCASADGAACTPHSAQWGAGWLVQSASGTEWQLLSVFQLPLFIPSRATSATVSFSPAGRLLNGLQQRVMFHESERESGIAVEVAPYGAIHLRRH